MNPHLTGKDLTKEPPRSAKTKVGGFYILGRTTDKCRAVLFANIGPYHFDCPLDNQLFGWKGIRGVDFKAYVAEGHNDDEIADWVRSHGNAKTTDEIEAWNAKVFNDNYTDKPDKKPWLEGENKRLGLNKDATLFDMLDADDKASYRNR